MNSQEEIKQLKESLKQAETVQEELDLRVSTLKRFTMSAKTCTAVSIGNQLSGIFC